ncbi:MAG: hypothetical protein ACRDHP_10825 [Ktedonobacterales bacterium]
MLGISASYTAKQLAQLRAHPALTRAKVVVRRIAPLAPVLVVAAWLVIISFVYFMEQGYGTKRTWRGVAAFADIGTLAGSHLGLTDLVMNHNPVGFDGQFYYFAALDPTQPIICAHQPPNCAFDIAFGEVRAERILYPYTAFLASFGQARLVPYALLAVNFFAVLIVAWLVGKMAVAAGASRWMGAAAGLFCGEVLGFLRDLADPFAVMWVVVAVYFLRKQRYLLSALAIAAALLTREQLILTLPLLALPLLVERRWRTLAWSAAVALGPFVVWQVVLRIIWGKWALLTGDTAGAGVSNGTSLVPFHGLWQDHLLPEFGMIVAFVAVPVIFASVVCIRAIWQRFQAGGWRAALLDPLPIFTLGYALTFSITNGILWGDMWTPGRLAAEAAVLGVVVVAQYGSPSVRSSYGTLLAFTGLAALMLVIV